jgi:VanZ family protein
VRLASAPPCSRAVPTAAHYRWAAVGLVAFTFYGGLLPFHFTPMPLAEAVAVFRNATVWDPSDLMARGDWVVSIIQYAVLSYALMAAVCCDRRWSIGLIAALLVVPICAAVAVSIEFLQVYFPPRTVSVNDILVESAGGILGAGAWLAVGRRVTAWGRRLEGVTSLAGLARRLLPAYVVALLVVQLMPFDFVFGRDELAVKAAEGKIRLAPFGGGVDAALFGKMALAAAAFFPLGFLPALIRRRSRQPIGWLAGLSWALLGPALIEGGKLFVYSRTFEGANVLASMIGVMAGRWLGGRTRTRVLAAWAAAPRVGLLWTVLWLAWMGTILYCNWRPFDFTTDPAQFAADSDELPAVGMRRMALAPFVDYYWSSKYNALDRFAFKGLSFLPAGVLLALASRNIYGPGSGLRAVIMVAAVAIVVEAGRYFLPSRVPSVTDVVIQCAGAWLGFRMTQFVRATLWAEAALYGWLSPRPEPLHFITGQLDILPLYQSRQHFG